jgi:hypothetical protein
MMAHSSSIASAVNDANGTYAHPRPRKPDSISLFKPQVEDGMLKVNGKEATSAASRCVEVDQRRL